MSNFALDGLILRSVRPKIASKPYCSGQPYRSTLSVNPIGHAVLLCVAVSWPYRPPLSVNPIDHAASLCGAVVFPYRPTLSVNPIGHAASLRGAVFFPYRAVGENLVRQRKSRPLAKISASGKRSNFSDWLEIRSGQRSKYADALLICIVNQTKSK